MEGLGGGRVTYSWLSMSYTTCRIDQSNGRVDGYADILVDKLAQHVVLYHPIKKRTFNLNFVYFDAAQHVLHNLQRSLG